MSFAETTASIQALDRARVLNVTFGHLKPRPRKKYRGTLVFTQSEFGQLVPIRAHFPDLPDSPWLFEHITEFVAEKAKEPGEVYRFDGTYMTFLNGRPSFSGTVTKVSI